MVLNVVCVIVYPLIPFWKHQDISVNVYIPMIYYDMGSEIEGNTTINENEMNIIYHNSCGL